VALLPVGTRQIFPPYFVAARFIPDSHGAQHHHPIRQKYHLESLITMRQ